jgi:hypothetical protein
MTKLTPEEVELVLGKMLFKTCPHCSTGQRVISWKYNPCLYNLCKVKMFDVELTDTEIVEELLKMAKEPKEPKKFWVKKEPKLQRLGNGSAILVDQGGEWK